MPLATAIGGTFAQALGGTGIGVVVIKYLYGLYEAAYVDAFLEGMFLIAPRNPMQPTDCPLSGSVHHRSHVDPSWTLHTHTSHESTKVPDGGMDRHCSEHLYVLQHGNVNFPLHDTLSTALTKLPQK